MTSVMTLPATSQARSANALGELIARLRRGAGLSQGELARAVGLRGNSYVSRVERGSVVPSDRLTRRLAFALGVELSTLETAAGQANASSELVPFFGELEVEVARMRRLLEAEVRSLGHQIEHYRDRVASALRSSRLNIVWSEQEQLAYEAGARQVWVVTRELKSELRSNELRAVVAKNLARGARYRYLVPDTPPVRRRADKLLEIVGDRGELEVRLLPPKLFAFATDAVLYDADDARRKLGLVVAPTPRTEYDFVMGRAYLRRFVMSFRSTWRTAARCQASVAAVTRAAT